ncbi:MAG: glycosyltransferase [Desulfatibacillaceae bacterium]|nr:glycosyltransferase [Desulfatibacillaceae bacterium]
MPEINRQKPPFRVLFASEGFIVDGVASYNLYLAAALQKAGISTAVLGRWMGFSGYQQRLREAGVEVIQDLSPTVASPFLAARARRFSPHVVITDSRRTFPFALKIKQAIGAKLVTIFHDPPQMDRNGSRGMEQILVNSDAGVTPEQIIFEDLKKLSVNLAVQYIPRPLSGMNKPFDWPQKEPFRLLCFGRLSGWKSPGMRTIIDNALLLKNRIPSLEIDVMGGGWRLAPFYMAASRANRAKGVKFVSILGPQSDPRPFIGRACAVCAGANAAAESILCNRLVLAFAGYYQGPVTSANLEQGIYNNFGERGGPFLTKDNPGKVLDGLMEIYESWKNDGEQKTAHLRDILSSHFDEKAVAEQFVDLFQRIL